VTQWTKFRERLMGGRADNNIDFDTLCAFLERLGLEGDTEGSHRVFGRTGIAESIVLQPRGDGKAKAYQVRQIRAFITHNDLWIGDVTVDSIVGRYRCVIQWSEDDQAYIVSVPALPGLMADGATREAAFAALEEAAGAWMNFRRKRGMPIPEPERDLAVA
jgi:predicted RNase H-like HicB family nuclease